MGQALLFYAFSTILILSSVMVISARNTVHSVLFLILAFFNAAGLFLLAGAELLAFLLVIVYVGAVAVLFLFIVMMLDINFRGLRRGIAKYGLFGGLVGAVLVSELIMVALSWAPSPGMRPHEIVSDLTNSHALGGLLYTHYFYIFQISGFVLLVAMIGAIVLTLRKRTDVRRQNHQTQLARSPSTTLEIKKVQFRQGVKS